MGVEVSEGLAAGVLGALEVGALAGVRELVPDPTAVCRKPRRSRARLLELCRREPALLREVSRGVALATAECQHQFAGRRWNCTMARRSLRKILTRGNGRY